MTDRDTVNETVKAARDRELSQETVRERIAIGLATTAVRVYRRARPSGLLYTGGDVTVAGLRALGGTTVALTGDVVETGIPLGRLVNGVAGETPVITKAGGFGTNRTTINCLELLAANDE